MATVRTIQLPKRQGICNPSQSSIDAAKSQAPDTAFNNEQKSTWSPCDDVHPFPFLEGPAGLLGVGAAYQQLAPQLWLCEVLLKAVHEVMGLLCQVLGGLQNDGSGLAVV